jgi:hypothetical protein
VAVAQLWIVRQNNVHKESKVEENMIKLKHLKATGVVLLCAFCCIVNAQIYVGADGYIGEYTTAGTTVNAELISEGCWGMAWDGNSYLYVANEGGRSVGKFTTAGATVNSTLITVRGDPEGVALDGNGYIYVVDALFGTVGKYTTSGATVNASLITGLPTDGFASIACDGDGHLFVANSGYGSDSIQE